MIMDWEKCERDFVRSVSVDIARISSLVKTSQVRFKRAKTPFENNVSFALEDYYESIKELLVAYMLKRGFKSSNHQCLISFFFKESGLEQESLLIQRMSYYRNRLTYYGEDVPHAFVSDNSDAFEHVFTLLLEDLR